MSTRICAETATNVCDGACAKHVGEVYLVRVAGSLHGAMHFNYCQEARDEDRRRGFTVDAVDDVEEVCGE